MSHELTGIIVPLVTPFDSDESLNEAALRQIVDYLVERGVHGLFPCGSQGEFFALTLDEKKRVIDIVLEQNNGRAVVMPNTGAVSTRETVELSRHAEHAGADAISVITPFFIKPSPQELIEHLLCVADAVDLPVLGYNNPDRAGVNLSPAVASAVAKRASNFVGIKDSSGDLSNTLAYIEQIPPPFRTYMGRDTLIYAGLCYGCAGAVAATANVVPELVVGIYDAYVRGDHALAWKRQRQLSPLRQAFALGSFPVVVKEAMECIGLPAGPARRPIAPLTEAARRQLVAILEQLGAPG